MADDIVALRAELAQLQIAVERVERAIAERDAQPGSWFQPVMSKITEGIGKRVRQEIAREIAKSEASNFDVSRALERRLVRLESAAKK